MDQILKAALNEMGGVETYITGASNEARIVNENLKQAQCVIKGFYGGQAGLNMKDSIEAIARDLYSIPGDLLAINNLINAEKTDIQKK